VMPGGVMSIWPFKIGKFLELPYTLPQDYTLFNIMGETSPRIWFEKIDFIEKYHGMALVIVHPDYSGTGRLNQIYPSFLEEMASRPGYWRALPRNVARWWDQRTYKSNGYSATSKDLSRAALIDDILEIQENS